MCVISAAVAFMSWKGWAPREGSSTGAASSVTTAAPRYACPTTLTTSYMVCVCTINVFTLSLIDDHYQSLVFLQFYACFKNNRWLAFNGCCHKMGDARCENGLLFCVAVGACLRPNKLLFCYHCTVIWSKMCVLGQGFYCWPVMTVGPTHKLKALSKMLF